MTRETKSITVVQCPVYNDELPALDQPPFPGPLGQRVFDTVSKLGWKAWQEQATLIINHYGLNMADPQAQEYIFQQMEAFLFGQEDENTPAGP